MADTIREHQCPNCGAPLGIPEKHERFFKCQFCGTVLEDQATEEEQETGVFKIKITSEDIAAARQPEVPVYTAPPMTTKYTAADVGRATGRASCVLTVLIALLSLGAIALAFVPGLFASGALSGFLERAGLGEWLEGSPIGEAIPQAPPAALGGRQITSFAMTVLLPSDNDTSPDVATVARLSGDSLGLLYIDFESQEQLRWMALLGEEVPYHNTSILPGQTQLFFNTGTTLAAYNRQNGARIWEAALPDEIQHNICQDCLQPFGDSIVALTKDGTLTAFDAATGDQLWRQRLNEIPRQIVNFGAQPAVLDKGDGDPYLQIFDPASGQPTGQVRPQCPNEPFPNDPQTPGVGSPMAVSRDGKSVYFLAGFFEPGCVQRWDTATGEMVWQATFPVDFARSNAHDNLLLTDERLFIVNDSGALALDLSDGTFRQLVAEEDYNFLPLGAQDGVLVTLAERTRGTRRWELWGLDAELGNVKWTFVPQNAELLDRFPAPLLGAPGWVAGLTPQGLSLAVIEPESTTLILQKIPVQSGTASSPATLQLRGSFGGAAVNLGGWVGNQLVLTFGRDLYSIDIADGAIDHLWP